MKKIEGKTEVTVIGGGVVGCFITYFLAKAGVDVVLIERGDLASGAVGASNGWLDISNDTPNLENLCHLARKMYHNLDETLKQEIEYREENTIACYTEEDYCRLTKVGARRIHMMVRRDDLKEPEPNLAEDISWVIEGRLPFVNPNKLCYSFSDRAKRFGAMILTHTEAVDIDMSAGRVRQVITNKGKIRTGIVVNAAGAWTPVIGNMVGIKIPIIPLKGQILVTEPTPPLIYNYYSIGGSGWNTRLFPEKEAEWSPYLKYGVFPGTIIDYWPGENAYLIAGNRFEMDALEYPAHLIPEASKLIAEHAIRFVPKLGELHIIREFAGLRPVCNIDGLPILGKVEGIEGFIVATGTDHYGVSAGMIFGKLISELITKNTTSESIDEFSYSRFRRFNSVRK